MIDRYKTEGIRYTGSKREIIPVIDRIIIDNNLEIKTVLDGFSGTTRVGQFFKKAGYNVTSNDLAVYSRVFSDCYIANNNVINLIDKLTHLNNLKGIFGWFSENYGAPDGIHAIGKDGLKKPWMLHNTMKLDAIRDEIDKVSDSNIEKSILLTSLINAMDKVDNTLGHQVAYLKDWSIRSRNTMKLESPQLITNNIECFSIQKDIFDIKDHYDLAYLDPPYGTNNNITKTTRVRYASYYHIWTTLVKNDKPKLVGKSLRREDFGSDRNVGAISVFEQTNESAVKESIKALIDNINAKYIIFSYSSKSRVPLVSLNEIFGKYKMLDFISFKHKENVMKRLTINKNWMGDVNENLEYLFLMER